MGNIEELEKQLEQVNKDLEVNKQVLIDSLNTVPIELLDLDTIVQVINDLKNHKKELSYFINQNKMDNIF